MKVPCGTSWSLLHCLQLADLAMFWCYVNQQNSLGSLCHLPFSSLSLSCTLFSLLICSPHIFPLSISPGSVSVWFTCPGRFQCQILSVGMHNMYFSFNIDNCLPSIANSNKMVISMQSQTPPPLLSCCSSRKCSPCEYSLYQHFIFGVNTREWFSMDIMTVEK